jgi:hypothetical protein
MPLDGRFAATAGETAPRSAPFPHAGCRWTSDDLNYLFHRQQIELSRSANAPSAAARAVHGRFARLYEDAIEDVTGGNIRFRHAPVAAWARGGPGQN